MVDFKGPDWEWRLQLTALVAEVKANQDNLDKKIDTYIGTSQARLDELEKSIYGKNDVPGLHEEVRDLKGRWAIFYGLILLFTSAVVNQVVDTAVANVKPTNMSAIVQEATITDAKR